MLRFLTNHLFYLIVEFQLNGESLVIGFLLKYCRPKSFAGYCIEIRETERPFDNGCILIARIFSIE